MSANESIRRRSTPAAVFLVFLVVLTAAVIVTVVTLIGDVLAGGAGALVAAIVAQIALLTFVTVRAYPPDVKRPFAMFVVATVLVSSLVPLMYLSWLWVTQKKWYDARREPPAAGGVSTNAG